MVGVDYVAVGRSTISVDGLGFLYFFEDWRCQLDQSALLGFLENRIYSQAAVNLERLASFSYWIDACRVVCATTQ